MSWGWVDLAWVLAVTAGVLAYALGGWSVERGHWFRYVVSWWRGLLGI